MTRAGGADFANGFPEVCLARSAKADEPTTYRSAGTRPVKVMGRGRQLCPGTSDVDFLSDLKRVVVFDTEIANGAFDLRVTKK
jgi:hypothetical protein